MSKEGAGAGEENEQENDYEHELDQEQEQGNIKSTARPEVYQQNIFPANNDLH